jgi:hypothetical protein
MTEQEYQQELQKIFDNAPEKYHRKLEQLQWKCDAIRAANPGNHVECMVQITKMMLKSVEELDSKWKELAKLANTEEITDK